MGCQNNLFKNYLHATCIISLIFCLIFNNLFSFDPASSAERLIDSVLTLFPFTQEEHIIYHDIFINNF